MCVMCVPLAAQSCNSVTLSVAICVRLWVGWQKKNPQNLCEMTNSAIWSVGQEILAIVSARREQGCENEIESVRGYSEGG